MEEQNSFQRPKSHNKPEGKKNNCLKGLIILVSILIILIGGLLYSLALLKKIKTGEINESSLLKNEKNINTNSIEVMLPDPYLGSDDAKVIIIEYSDFQCPACAAASQTIKQLNVTYGDIIMIIYRDFPLYDSHSDAVKAAIAGQCAHAQEQFWVMHDKLFSNQESLAVSDLKRYAVEIGLDSVKFSNCLDSNQYISSVQKDFEEGVSIGIKSTPSFIINNQVIEGVPTFEQLQQIIEQELTQKIE
ncbi:DsbA family protein [Patescibacteria group bacterium]|nr:DsbA family protein [Patescibacteria group bacterium]